jgi:hypothetical protein
LLAALLSVTLGGACARLVGISDTVSDGAGGVASTGSGGYAASGGVPGVGGNEAGGAGGFVAGIGGAGGMVTAGAGGGNGASGGTGGTNVVTGIGGAMAVGGHGAGGSGGNSTGGVGGAGGVSTGGKGGTGGTGGAVASCSGTATQCAAAQVQSCVGGQWSLAMDCPAHQTCTGTACACVVDPVCPRLGAICVTSRSLATCAAAGSCFYQLSPTMNCAGTTVCERSGTASCGDPAWAEWPVPATKSPTAYTDNGDGTVTDNVTGLMWSQPVGALITQAAAIAYCSMTMRAGGYSDWRLPTKVELLSIVDYGTSNPSINAVFKNSTTEYYWTSTTYAQNTSNAWLVHFTVGTVLTNAATAMNNARCVR